MRRRDFLKAGAATAAATLAGCAAAPGAAAKARVVVVGGGYGGATAARYIRRLDPAIEAMPDGGVFVLSIPEAPYRCPPGPYERACQVAAYFKAAKPRSKVLLLDANGDVISKGALFKKAWSELYGDIIEYRPNSKAVDVDVAGRIVKLEFA